MIRVNRAHLHVAAQTHPGMTGKQNEDRFAVSAYRVGSNNPTPAVFAVVADGIGGHRAGEQAAEMAVNAISHTVARSDGFEPLATLQQAIHNASQMIASQARDDTQRLGMGTTCACVWVIGQRLYTASVGDSRIYLLRGTTMRQLTTDHTWVQEAIEKGILDAGHAQDHPNIHVIRRYLGSVKPPAADLRMRVRGDESDTQAKANQGFPLRPGDRLLLCTDGLTDEVSDEEIRSTAAERRPVKSSAVKLDSVAKGLIKLANSHGGHDNITVVLIQVPGKQYRRRNRIWPWLVAALAGMLFVLALTAGLVWFKLSPVMNPWPIGNPWSPLLIPTRTQPVPTSPLLTPTLTQPIPAPTSSAIPGTETPPVLPAGGIPRHTPLPNPSP